MLEVDVTNNSRARLVTYDRVSLYYVVLSETILLFNLINSPLASSPVSLISRTCVKGQIYTSAGERLGTRPLSTTF